MTTLVERLRQIANLWDSYKRLVATEMLCAADIGNDPEVLREAALALEEAEALLRRFQKHSTDRYERVNLLRDTDRYFTKRHPNDE